LDYAAISAIFLSVLGVLPAIITTIATLLAIVWYSMQFNEHRMGRRAELLADAIVAKAKANAAAVVAEATVQAAAVLAQARVEAAKIVAAAPPSSEATAALAVAIVQVLPDTKGSD